MRIPAAYCEVLGFRPSHEAIPSIGVVPVSQSLDTVGLFPDYFLQFYSLIIVNSNACLVSFVSQDGLLGIQKFYTK